MDSYKSGKTGHLSCSGSQLEHRKCWKDPLMSSPYKEIAIREAWKKSVQLQGASREY